MRLPRLFWGEIIYVTPGSGKTFVANKYDDVIDSDDVIVDIIKEKYTTFIVHEYDDPREVLFKYFAYIKFNRKRMNEIYKRAAKRMKKHAALNNVVFLGTRDLMHIADRIIVQKNDSVTRNGFDSDKEEQKLQDIDSDNIHYIDDYLEGCLHKICQGKIR